MAKWGEGDPRWIVEHRDDGKNVNGWHWSEVNRMEWSKQRLEQLLPGTEAEGAAGWVARVTKVKSVTGEAMVTTRKGNKRFAIYDLTLALAWEAAPAPAAGGASTEGAAEAAVGGAADGEAKGGPPAQPGSGSAEPAASGEISVAEFGSGSDHDDIEVTVSVSGGAASQADKEAARRAAHAALWPQVLQQLEQFVKELGDS